MYKLCRRLCRYGGKIAGLLERESADYECVNHICLLQACFKYQFFRYVQEIASLLGLKMKAAVKVKAQLDELRASTKRVKCVHIFCN